MRILTVSAHYPPNFVSGGTLQPQRLSRGLRDRGHDVSVFAGWIGDRPPLEEWDDDDETGLPVHWVVSSPWIGWADERNWLNPEVTEAFRRHLDVVRPDVVHLHALQSLGAGLLPVARAAGARVVVTMHDFWWLCSRQFLVDPTMTPCSLVVDAGTCPCQVDESWRRHRGRGLATLLESADLVLAPSASAAAVLEANGVAPGRLQVDENGLPAAVVSELRRTDREPRDEVTPGTVRVLYTGGPNPLKGADVLLDAAQLLATTPGWRLSAYGIDEHLEKTGRSVADLPVDVLDPFAPDELRSVLEAHDVLVLPSLARETHSLMTREALSAGLPVVCADAPGPEEVVRHGVNGLVVPAGDAAALAAALGEVIGSADLRRELVLGATEPVAARSLDEQVADLEDRFAGLLAAPGSSTGEPPGPVEPAARSRVRDVLFVVGIDGAPLRYRARLPAEALAMVGVRTEVRHYRDPDLLARGGRADVVVLYRVPATVQVLELIDAWHGAGVACAFDVDDLIFDPDIRAEVPALDRLPADEAALWLQGVERYRTTLEACDAYIGSTSMLVEHANALTGLPAHRFDNGVGRLLARAADRELRRPRRPGPTRLGYLSGTTTHDEDWFFVEPAIEEVLDRHPTVELWLGGHLPESAALERFGPRVSRLPFLPWLELPAVLRDLDVNLSPLTPGSRFNEAKSAIKWLEAALCATPTVASPTRPFREAIDDGDTGRLAGDPSQWVTALDELVRDEVARARMGSMARRRALLQWSPGPQGRRYLQILEAVADAGPRRAGVGATGATWVPVTLDEPALPGVELERYADPLSEGEPAPGGPSPATTPTGEAPPTRLVQVVARAESLARRGTASVRRDGVSATLRKVADRLQTRLRR